MELIKFNRAIKYRIYPSERQLEQLTQTFGCVRKVYNLGIELQQGLYYAGMGRLNKTALNNYCNRVWKDEWPYLREVDKFAVTNSLFNLDAAFQKFFAQKGGYPKFKTKRDHCDSYTTNACNGNIRLDLPSNRTSTRGRIKLPKLGWVEACIHRCPGQGWVLKQATVSRNAQGKYFASVLFEYYREVEIRIPAYDNTIGLDYSSPKFYVDNEGRSPEMAHWYRRTEQRLAKEQRKLSRMVKGSGNYEQQRRLIARLQENIAAQRKDFCHKLSREIANSCDAVCVESLDLRAMAGGLRLGKATLDNGFGMFRSFLRYKLEEQGKQLSLVDKWYPSTKTCHACGGYHPDIALGESSWECPCCGKELQRDQNAACNIRDEGFRKIMRKLA